MLATSLEMVSEHVTQLQLKANSCMPLNYQAVLAPYQGKGKPMARCAGAQELQARWAPEANRKDSPGMGSHLRRGPG